MFGFESMLNTNEMIKNLKLASSKCVGGYYFIMIRPALRDRIVELLEEKEKERKAVKPLFNERMNYFVCKNCSLVLDEGRDNYCPSCGTEIAWSEYYIDEEERR